MFILNQVPIQGHYHCRVFAVMKFCKIKSGLLVVVLVLCALTCRAIAGELSDSLVFGNADAEQQHGLQGVGFGEVIAARVGTINEVTPCRTSASPIGSSFQFDLRKQPGQTFALQIQEVYPVDSPGTRYSYQVDANDRTVYLRDNTGLMCGSVSYFVNVDDPLLLSESQITLKFTNTRAGSPFRIAAVWIYSDFPSYLGASGFDTPFYLTPLINESSVESNIEQDISYLKTNIVPSAGSDVRLGCSQEYYYMLRDATSIRTQTEWLLKYAKQYGVPACPLFVSWWAGTPNGSDGQGGSFSDPKYQQVCWSETDNFDEGQSLKTLLGSKWDLRYGWTVPNQWSNTPWLTMNSPVLNNSRHKAIAEKLSEVGSVLTNPANASYSDYLLGIGMENEPRYWDYLCPDGNYPVQRQNLWGDFNPLTVADAAGDGVVLDPADGLSYAERMWLHNNVADYQQGTYDAHESALRSLRLPFANSAKDSLWHEVYSHAFPTLVFPMDQVTTYHPGLEWNRLRGCRPGLEDVANPAARYLERTREWGRWSQVNYEENNGLAINLHLRALRACYAFGARMYHFYNWQSINAGGQWTAYVQAFCADGPRAMVRQVAALPTATYQTVSTCRFTINVPSSWATLNEIAVSLNSPGDYTLKVYDTSAMSRAVGYRRKIVDAAGVVRFDLPNCIATDQSPSPYAVLTRTDGMPFGVLANPTSFVWSAWSDSGRERTQSLLLCWRADAHALIADLKAKGVPELGLAEQLFAAGDYRRAYDEASRLEKAIPQAAWERQIISPYTPIPEGTPGLALAVDPRNGNLYVPNVGWSGMGMIDKYDYLGQKKMPFYGCWYQQSVRICLPKGNPTAMSVDPLTGYLYMVSEGTHYAMQMSYTPDAWCMHVVDDGVGGAESHTAFSDDGQKYYITGMLPGNVWGVRELTRFDPGTPSDPYDDVFSQANGYVDYTTSGVLPTAGFADCRGVAVDRSGQIYATDMDGAAKHPVRRYTPGSPASPNLEFYGAAPRSWGCATDAVGNLWMGDVASGPGDQAAHHLVRCYSQGKQIASIDPSTGHITEPSVVAFDRINNRLLVLGKSGNAENSPVYLQSWIIEPSQLLPGKLDGRVVDSATGAPAQADWIGIAPTYADTEPGFRMNFHGAAPAGSYSLDLPPGLYNVSASGAGYLTSAVSHNDVRAGVTTVVPDIPLLPAASDHVSIQLGEHNVEQGLFMKSTQPLKNVSNPLGGSASFADTIAERACRGFGRASNGRDECYMDFDVDDEFINNAVPGIPTWLEVELFDGGYDRWSVGMDTSLSPVTSLGTMMKGNSGAWQTSSFVRGDARLGGRITGTAGSADMRLGSLPSDGLIPSGVDYVSRLTLHKTVTGASYQAVGSIGEVKRMASGPDGVAVRLAGKIVTQSESGSFYMQEPDRSSGIRVLYTGAPPAAESIVGVDGTLTALPDTGELAISGHAVHADGSTASALPLAMIGMAVAGGPVSRTFTVDGATYTMLTQAGVWGWGYMIAADGKPKRTWMPASGLSNIGLLVRTFGKVKSVDEATHSFVLDDGSDVDVRCVLPDDVNIDPSWTYVSITGVSSCEAAGQELGRLIRVRTQSDIRPQ